MTKEISNKIANLGVIGALMVVLIHIPKCETGSVAIMYKILPDGLLGSAVMMFFAISGYLIAGHVDEKGWWGHECRKRIRTLLVPYVVLNLFYFLVMAAYHCAGAGASEFSFSVRGILAAEGVIGGNPIIGPLWYVRCLLLAVLTLPLFMPVIRCGKGMAFGLCLLIYLGSIALKGHGGFIFGNVYRLHGISFFLLGVTLRRYGIPNLSKKLGYVAMALAFSLALTMTLVEACVITKVAYWLVKPVAVVAMWILIPSAPWSKLLTANTFEVYVLHYMIVHPSWLIFEKLGIYDKVFGSLITYFLFPVLIFAAIVFFAELMKRHLPKFAAIVFGGR